MMSTTERLRLRAAVLETIDRRRRETGDANLGSAIEDCILSYELRELEAEILSNREAPEGVPVLVPRTLRASVEFQK
jgi:hypothetical protein